MGDSGTGPAVSAGGRRPFGRSLGDDLDALERRIEWESGNPGLTCARCHEICEDSGRAFMCQAREACEPVSAENELAEEVFLTMRILGSLSDTLALFDLTLTPAGLTGLRLRLMKLALLERRRTA